MNFDVNLECAILTGSDVRDWLQGQITQDVRLLSPDSPIAFCLTSATGQIVGLGTLCETPEGVVVVADPQSIAVLGQRLETYVIMEEVEMKPITQGPFPVWAGRGFEVLGDFEVGNRLERGWPELGVDIDAKTFPQELGEGFVKTHVSFTKGCYLGQEVVHRIHARGKVNRVWAAIESDTELRVGDGRVTRVEEIGESWFGGGLFPISEAENLRRIPI